MEKKIYEKPELEVIETADIDILNASFGDDWDGTKEDDYGFPWLPKNQGEKYDESNEFKKKFNHTFNFNPYGCYCIYDWPMWRILSKG